MRFSHAVLVVLVLHVIAVGAIFAFNSIKAKQTAIAKTTPTQSAPATSGSTSPAAETATTAPASDGKTHTVQSGDTLTRIAALYNVTVDSLLAANELTSISILRIGQVLKVPAPGEVTAKTTDTKVESKPEAPAKTETKTSTQNVVASVPVPAKTTTTAPTAKTDAPAPVTTKPAPKEEVAASSDVYVVAKGDNPYSIAKKLHVSYNALLEINEIKDPTKIQIGQKLKLPKKTTN